MIAGFINTASRHFGLPRTSKAASVHLVIQANHITQEPRTMTYATTATSPATMTAQIDAAYANQAVQVAAERLTAKQQLLAEITGSRAVIAAAIEATGTADPAAIVEALGCMASGTDAEIAAARAEKQQHDAQRRERRMARQPLRAAVSARITALAQEKESLVGRIAAAANASRMTGATGQLRYENLRASGLTDKQIVGLGEGLQSPTDLSNEHQARIAAINSELEPLFAFANDPLGDPAPLAGLGLDALIAARLDAEGVAA